MAETVERDPRLTEAEVQKRLQQCTDPKVIDELYEFGMTLNKEGLEQLKNAETKATSFAAYGAAIATLLVSSGSTWTKAGNTWSFWIAFFAGLSALFCTFFAVQALKLTTIRTFSQEDWLKEEYLRSPEDLKVYHVFATWQVINFRLDVQRRKANSLLMSQVWLAGAVGYLVLLLLQATFAHLRVIHLVVACDVLGCEWGKWLTQWSGWAWLLVCGLGLGLLAWRTRSVRIVLGHR